MSNRLPYAGYVSFIVRDMQPEAAQEVRRDYFSPKTKPHKWSEYTAYCADNGYTPDKPDFEVKAEIPTAMKVLGALALAPLWFLVLCMAIVVESVKRGKYY